MGGGSLQGTVLGAGPRGVGGDGGSPGPPEMASGAQNLFPLEVAIPEHRSADISAGGRWGSEG